MIKSTVNCSESPSTGKKKGEGGWETGMEWREDAGKGVEGGKGLELWHTSSQQLSCWEKHQGVSRSEMTRLAQSTSCQHSKLMCTDNFIPPPQTPSSPFSSRFFLVFFTWLFVSCPAASQPASHLLSVCTESALSSLARGFSVCVFEGKKGCVGGV